MHIILTEVIALDIKEAVAGSFGTVSSLGQELPRIMIIGRSEIYVENYLTLAEYNPDRIRLITRLGMAEINGGGFEIVQMKEHHIIINGKILGLRLI